MVIKSMLKMIFQVYVIFIMTWYMPFEFRLFNSSCSIGLDFIYLYLVIQSFFLQRYQLIFLGLFIGFLIDFDIETSRLGLNAFFMPITCYFLALVKLNKNNWTFHFKVTYLIFVLYLSFLNKYFYYEYYYLGFFDLIAIGINSVLIIISILCISKYLFKKSLIY